MCLTSSHVMKTINIKNSNKGTVKTALMGSNKHWITQKGIWRKFELKESQERQINKNGYRFCLHLTSLSNTQKWKATFKFTAKNFWHVKDYIWFDFGQRYKIVTRRYKDQVPCELPLYKITQEL